MGLFSVLLSAFLAATGGLQPAANEAGPLDPTRQALGSSFQDCPDCPEMVVIPAGSFTMGSPPDEEGRYDGEGPPHRVTIGRSFAAGRFEVTRAEYAAFVRDTGHGLGDGCSSNTGNRWKLSLSKSWRDPGFVQTDRDPVVCVSWDDVQAYVSWLSRKTGNPYRLLSEAEWEYVARAGTSTPFWTGSKLSPDQANYNGAYSDGSGRKAIYRERTVPVGIYAANAFGLHDVHGNVCEWVEDCWNDNYAGAPSDGSAWLRGSCGVRGLRGGSFIFTPRNLRSAHRNGLASGDRTIDQGFRVARDLD